MLGKAARCSLWQGLGGIPRGHDCWAWTHAAPPIGAPASQHPLSSPRTAAAPHARIQLQRRVYASSGRRYPTQPLVGVGIILFRRQPSAADLDPEVLIIQRAKEPGKGMWSFPGGGLELGETLADCAERELREETGLALVHARDPGAEGFSNSLAFPTPFAACDALTHDAEGRLQYHYAIIDVAAVAADPGALPHPSDDVSDARYVRVSALRAWQRMTPSCARFAEEAVKRFCVR